MKRQTVRAMRNKSFDMWLYLTQTISKIKDESLSNAKDESIIIQQFTQNLKQNIHKASQAQYSTEKTNKCRFILAIIGVILCIYSIIISSVIINHLKVAENYCTNSKHDEDKIKDRPELYVYNHCTYHVYALFAGSHVADSCECRVFVLDWNDVNISSVGIDPLVVMDAVLTEWTMLEKIDVSYKGNPKTISFNINKTLALTSHHFHATQMKLFRWSDLAISYIDNSIINWEYLSMFEMKKIDTLYELPNTFSQLKHLKAIKLDNMNYLNNYFELICDLTNLARLSIIHSESITYIPNCVSQLTHLWSFVVQNTPIKSFPSQLLSDMQNVIELDLWRNKIDYIYFVEFNDIDLNDTQFWQYFEMNKMIETVVFNDNPICEELKTLPKSFRNWANETRICYKPYEECNDCNPTDTGDGFCSGQCENKQCYFEGGDCYQLCFTKTDCTLDLFTNTVCDEECNNLECNFDATYCNLDTNSPTQKPGMPPPDGTKPPPDGKGAPPMGG